MLGYAGVLAHQGGWDEALMVIVPVALFVGLLWLATRRAADQGETGDPPADPSADGTTRPPGHGNGS